MVHVVRTSFLAWSLALLAVGLVLAYPGGLAASLTDGTSLARASYAHWRHDGLMQFLYTA